MHERSHWRSILAQPSPKSVLPTKQMCGACRFLGYFAPSSGPSYARVLCIFHERPLDISTHRVWHRFWVLFGSKPMAKTRRFQRFRASDEGKGLGQPYDGFRVVDGPPARRVCVVPGGPAHVRAARLGPPSNHPRSVRRERPRRRRARRSGFG